jgi:membrane protease YdiL (CAAX protease family)
MNTMDISSERIPNRRVAIVLGCLLLWLLYTLLQSLFLAGLLEDPLASLLRLLPGLAAAAILFSSRLPAHYNYLPFRRISTAGLALYAALLILYVFGVLPTGRYTGWNPPEALIYAPIGAMSQEIFFRVSLLPVLLWLQEGHPWPALLIHALLFGLWHIGAIFAGASLVEAIPVMLVPFLFGIAWGWQVVRDRTVVWAVLHHALLLVLMSFYAWA